jgi:hypothetical protein
MELLACNIPIPSSRKKSAEARQKLPVPQVVLLRNLVPCVMESVPGTPGIQKAEKILSEILARPGRIEEKIDEAVYPPESVIRPAYVKKIKEAGAGLAKGKGKTYPSMEDFIRNIRQ